MKTSTLTVSLLALTLIVPGFAQAQNAAPPAAPAAGANAAAQVAPIPPEVIKLLEDKRAIADIPEPELKGRFRTAARFAGDEALPPELRGQLKQFASAAQAELEARAQAAAQPAPAPKQQAEAPAQPVERSKSTRRGWWGRGVRSPTTP